MVIVTELDATRPLLEQALVLTNDANSPFLERLHSSETNTVPSSVPSLFVMQGENAICQANQFQYVGSEDATTCVIVIIEGNNYCYVSHIDEGSYNDMAIWDYITQCTDSGKVIAKLYLAGGYTGSVPDDFLRFLLRVKSYSSKLDLVLCCCGSANLQPDGFPRIRSLVLNTREGKPYPYTFEYRGPEIFRRHTARSLGQRSVSILDQEGRLVLKGFRCDLNPATEWFYKEMLQLAKRDPPQFLDNFSTSPLHESEVFIPDMIGMLEFCLKNSRKNIGPLAFVLDGAIWTAAV